VTFVTSESISTLAVDLLSAELSLTQTVSQVPSGDVAPPTGGETTLRVPVPREAKIQPRGASLDYTEIDEVPVDFSIDHIYDGARVTEHQRSLDIVISAGRSPATRCGPWSPEPSGSSRA